MPTRLYLDTARLGLMSRSAQQIHIDFVRFVGEEGASLYFDQLLTGGTAAWPASLRRRFPALQSWQGISHLKEALRRPAGASAQWQVLLASRSAQLMKLAAELLFRLCRNVLVTDLTWPSYRYILDRTGGRAENQLTTLSLRKRILKDKLQPDELVEQVVRSFLRHGCDGLFLPAVDNLGVRLPVERIVRAIKERTELRFVAVDGAQALGHVPLDLDEQYCDFLIAGCHKWLCAYHPMGIGFYGHPRSVGYIEQTIGRLQRQGSLDDPLIRFLGELSGKAPTRYGESVNLAPLFSCQGALQDTGRDDPTFVLPRRVANADQLVTLLGDHGWKPLRPADGLRSGILLLRSTAGHLQRLSPDVLRLRLHEVGLAVSAYPGGVVRVSLPAELWHPADLELVTRAFCRVGQPTAFPAALAN